MTADTFIADKAFDADERVIEPLRKAAKTVVIPSQSNRTVTRSYDEELDKARHLIVNLFAKLKQFRAINALPTFLERSSSPLQSRGLIDDMP